VIRSSDESPADCEMIMNTQATAEVEYFRILLVFYSKNTKNFVFLYFVLTHLYLAVFS
jgi:hypothetical protein